MFPSLRKMTHESLYNRPKSEEAKRIDTLSANRDNFRMKQLLAHPTNYINTLGELTLA